MVIMKVRINWLLGARVDDFALPIKVYLRRWVWLMLFLLGQVPLAWGVTPELMRFSFSRPMIL